MVTPGKFRMSIDERAAGVRGDIRELQGFITGMVAGSAMWPDGAMVRKADKAQGKLSEAQAYIDGIANATNFYQWVNLDKANELLKDAEEIVRDMLK